MRYTESLKSSFERLNLPADAVEWLIDVWEVCHLLDDACDGDDIGRGRAEAAAWTIFVRMPANTFWRANMANLMPVLAVQALKWQAANEAEDDGEADARSFMWRAGYYDLVLLVCQLCGLAQDPRFILSLYGETYFSYADEMHAPNTIIEGAS